MMIGRQLPAKDYLIIKAATRDLVGACGGPVKAATYTRVGHADISRYGSVHEDHVERFMPADVMADLEAQCGSPILSDALARLADYLLVKIPAVAKSGTLLGSVTAASMKETSDVFVAIGDSLGDGTLCQADADRISREIDEAMAKLAGLKLQVHAEVGGAE
jgi:hypothetical protein